VELFQKEQEEELCPFLGTVQGNQLWCKDCWDEGWDVHASKERQLSWGGDLQGISEYKMQAHL